MDGTKFSRASMMRIREVAAWVVDVPTLSEWMSSPEFGPHTLNECRTLLRLRSDSGAEGWGECSGDRLALLEKTAGRLLASDPATLRPSHLDLWDDDEIYWNRPSHTPEFRPDPANVRHRLRHPLQALVEFAFTDLCAREGGISVSRFFGGRWRDEVLTDYWAGRVSPEHAATCARRGKDLGFRGIKLKSTLEDPNVERLAAIRDAVGADFHVTVDPNGRFYRLDDAWPVIKEMDRIGNLGILEDPFPRFHLEDFRILRSRIDARLVVHIDPPESLGSVMASGAAGGLNIDSHQVGPFQWRILAGAAEQANLSVWHGGTCSLGIGTAWELQLAACAPNCQLPGDQSGPWLRAHTLVKEPFTVENGHVRVPLGPGIGVEIDWPALERYTRVSRTWT
jgi:muconate cycloisomerase